MDGAQHWQLNSHYVPWLAATASLPDGGQRGDEYYSSPDGEQLVAWPKIRTGSGGATTEWGKREREEAEAAEAEQGG